MTREIDILQGSVGRLRRIAGPLDSAGLATSAYPAEWSIADVLSHLGSGAVIFERRCDDALSGTDTPPDFARSVWDSWNAKTPEAKAADALAADEALLRRLGSASEAERARFELAMGPRSFDFAGFVRLRVNEHVLHTWDVEVALDPSATLDADAVELVLEGLGLVARWGGKPTGTTARIGVRTEAPRRDFTLGLETDSVTLTPGPPEDSSAEPDLAIPAEAFIRLVYGRLDPGHTPETHGSADLDELRRVFPGV